MMCKYTLFTIRVPSIIQRIRKMIPINVNISDVINKELVDVLTSAEEHALE